MVDLYHTLWIRPWPCCLPPQNILSDQRRRGKEGEGERYKQDGADDVIYNSKERHKIWWTTRNSTGSNCWKTSCPCLATFHFAMHLIIIHKKHCKCNQKYSKVSQIQRTVYAHLRKSAYFGNKRMYISRNTEWPLSLINSAPISWLLFYS